MKSIPERLFPVLFPVLIGLAFPGCVEENARQSQTDLLDPAAFALALESARQPVILDVRTPSEFMGGHLKGAVNADINSKGFSEFVSELERQNEIFVYCLSGGRSAHAIYQLEEDGFTRLHDLKGGILAWRAAGMPEEDANPNSGMSLEEFHTLLRSEKPVLVDFYAEWCGPCRKMKPYLDELASEREEALVVMRIDIEANRKLAKALDITTLPVIQYYSGTEKIWEHNGFMSKKEVLSRL